MTRAGRGMKQCLGRRLEIGPKSAPEICGIEEKEEMNPSLNQAIPVVPGL